MKKMLLIVIAVLLSVGLFACGGGGGGSSTDTGGTNTDTGGTSTDTGGSSSAYELVNPSKLSSIPTTGTPSFSDQVTDYGQGYLSIAGHIEGVSQQTNTYDDYQSDIYQIFSILHLDTNTLDSWGDGWTGAGTSISVVDDFYSSPISFDMETPIITRTATYNKGSYGISRGTHDLKYNFSLRYKSHGDAVSNIAGGDADGEENLLTVNNATVGSDILKGCEVISGSLYSWGSDPTCGIDYYDKDYRYNLTETIDLHYKDIAGIAKQSFVVNNHVDLSNGQDPIQTVADIQGHLQNSSDFTAINISIGSQIPTSGKTFEQVMAEVSGLPIPTVNAVVSVAAGNGGAPCATQDLNGCNALAIALAYQDASSASTVVVGALEGSGQQENIATYSTRAGVLAPRFILASGETGMEGVVGTSFAAPRVAAAAAIIKQKYPELTGEQIANVILLSASKDINNDGFDDFSGISPVFGHGKLDLEAALNLVNSY
jgi:hypothetical protein